MKESWDDIDIELRIAALRERAEHARRLAATLTDLRAREGLETYGEELTREAEELSAQRAVLRQEAVERNAEAEQPLAALKPPDAPPET